MAASKKLEPLVSEIRGFIVYDGPSELNGQRIVAIATIKSANPKTGQQVQISMIHPDMPPGVARKTGCDDRVCSDCPQRPAAGGGCYVTPMALSSIWRSFIAGKYPHLPAGCGALANIFARRVLRLGMYGDPAHVPLRIWQEMLSKAQGWTCFTHQWRDSRVAGLKNFCTASVDDPAEKLTAGAQGWRTFRVRPKGATFAFPGEQMCPASPEAGRGTTCIKCRQCSGWAGRGSTDHTIRVHGTKSKRWKGFGGC